MGRKGEIILKKEKIGGRKKGWKKGEICKGHKEGKKEGRKKVKNKKKQETRKEGKNEGKNK